MSVLLKIPTKVVQAIRFPAKDMQQQLLLELSVALYVRGALSFGKAHQLAGLNHYEFGKLLGQRHIPRHYQMEELQDDIAYARR
jgi:predicted HTH domain antitoxin